ncbi:Regulatory protein RepA [Anatilimnocola aggregata]|uniref:Regulatory protein RepA n=1 Tax=Anatilimnocola aggregata TaxID=2528021 RepID=A0A517YJ96_9BACT|nr:AAA family ATPase [Anatilimnocola aggregata]QDU30292.1 Regulatory protein RepA [Anatilimnocola aggregata]
MNHRTAKPRRQTILAAVNGYAKGRSALYDEQAERQVAGISILQHSLLAIVQDVLKPFHFADLASRACYVTGLEMLRESMPPDPLLFVARLKRHTDEAIDTAFISRLATNVQSIAHLSHYSELVIEKFELRQRHEHALTTQQMIIDGSSIPDIDAHSNLFVTSRERASSRIGSFAQMAKKDANQMLRRAVIEGIVREGETINVVSDSKVGKTWFVHGMALSICAGVDWIGYPVSQGKVLLLDNELHEPTLVHRIQQIAATLQIEESRFAERLDVECYRGRLVDIHGVVERLKQTTPGAYKAVILDSLYRFAPKGFDENSNAHTTELYNLIDSAAAHLGCAIVCVRHTSKGSQSNKSVTDTGAGAGAQSRAADCHLVLRAHEEESAFVVAAALRSFPKMEPFTVKFEWPVFFRTPELDPALLAPDKPRKSKTPLPEAPLEPSWDAELFASEFLTAAPQSQAAIIAAAVKAGMSERRASVLLRSATDSRLAFLWLGGDRRQKAFANRPQTPLGIVSESAE